MSRAGHEAARQARAERRRFVRNNRAVIGGFLAAYVGVVSVVALWAPWPGRGFALGGGMAGLAFVVFAILSLDGSQRLRRGADAERWSSSALRQLGKAQWRVVDNVPFEQGDVDHVAIGPTGVIAVETKYTSYPWEIRDSELDGPLGRPIDQAKLGARKIRLLLKSHGLDVQVAPALAVWGPGSANLTTDTVDGVVVLLGREAKLWRNQLPGTGHRFTDAEVDRIATVLESFVAMRSGRRRARHASA